MTFAAVAAGVISVWNLPRLLSGLHGPRFDFAPLADPPGFRRLAGGATSGRIDPFAGLSAPPASDGAITPDAVRADLCGVLFGAAPPPGVVPIASFSDYYCPYCRVLTERLTALEADPAAGVRLSWHEWPLLGEVSEVAARAALAAERQGAYVAFQKAPMRGGFVPTAAFLESLAARLGVDPERMAADMGSAAVSTEIADTRALARLFGFPGTPALVVGRTVVEGVIDDATLRGLVKVERKAGPPPGCPS